MRTHHHYVRHSYSYKGDHRPFNPNSTDYTTPKFAHDDEHVAAVLEAGGFWSWSERRVGLNRVRLCAPLMPPQVSHAG